jgi:hypothetical protein
MAFMPFSCQKPGCTGIVYPEPSSDYGRAWSRAVCDKCGEQPSEADLQQHGRTVLLKPESYPDD